MQPHSESKVGLFLATSVLVALAAFFNMVLAIIGNSAVIGCFGVGVYLISLVFFYLYTKCKRENRDYYLRKAFDDL